MAKRKKQKRKQPRRLTPPLFLRGDDGTREVVEVDHEHITQQIMQSTRTTAILILADGLRIQVSSRCINKRRVPLVRIAPKDHTPPAWQPEAPTFSDIRAQGPTQEIAEGITQVNLNHPQTFDALFGLLGEDR
jgi:hypothetical protein